MRRFILLAAMLIVAACGKNQESAPTPSSTSTAPGAAQPASPPPSPMTGAEPAPSAPPTATAQSAAPASGQSSGASGAAGASGSSGSSGASGAPGDYTVAAGDTLSGIARKNGVNARDIAQWNNLADPDRIHPGQTLRLTAP